MYSKRSSETTCRWSCMSASMSSYARKNVRTSGSALRNRMRASVMTANWPSPHRTQSNSAGFSVREQRNCRASPVTTRSSSTLSVCAPWRCEEAPRPPRRQGAADGDVQVRRQHRREMAPGLDVADEAAPRRPRLNADRVVADLADAVESGHVEQEAAVGQRLPGLGVTRAADGDGAARATGEVQGPTHVLRRPGGHHRARPLPDQAAEVGAGLLPALVVVAQRDGGTQRGDVHDSHGRVSGRRGFDSSSGGERPGATASIRQGLHTTTPMVLRPGLTGSPAADAACDEHRRVPTIQ